MKNDEKVGLKDLRWTVAVPVVLWWVSVVLIVTGLLISFVRAVVFGG
jgi:hypothetical protein